MSIYCDKCPLGVPKHGEPQKPMVMGDGNTNADIMFIGMNPGREEQQRGKPFIGPSGAVFDRCLKAAGIDRDNTYVTNVVKHITPGNRDPYVKEIRACRTFLDKEIALIKPKVIVALGGLVIKQFTGLGSVRDQRGRAIEMEHYIYDDGSLHPEPPDSDPEKLDFGSEYETFNFILMPTYHPASFLYSPGNEEVFVYDIQKAAEIAWGSLKLKETKYNVVKNLDEFSNTGLYDRISRTGKVAFDLETTPSKACEGEITDIAFCGKNGESVIVPVRTYDGKTTSKQECSQDLLAWIRTNIFNSSDIQLITHGGLYDFKWLLTHDLINYEAIEKSWFFDTLYINHLLNENCKSHKLEYLAGLYTTMPAWDADKQQYDKLLGKGNIYLMPPEERARYAAGDVDATWRIYKYLESQTKVEGLEDMARLIMEAVPVYAEMMANGMTVDKSRLEYLRSAYKASLRKVTKQIYDMVGYEFNINSDQQLVKALQEELGIEWPQNSFYRTNKKKEPSIRAEVRSALAKEQPHEIWGILDKHSGFEKLLSQYVGYSDDECTDNSIPANLCVEGKVHTRVNPHGTVSGRRSCAQPNLQQVPSRGEGKEVRTIFVPSKEDHVIISCDFDTAEFWLAAYMSQDPQMMDVFNRGEDIHTTTASKVFNVSKSQVTKDQRSIAKNINFAQLFGGDDYTLHTRYSIPRDEAKRYVEVFRQTYPQFIAWQEDLIRQVRERGYVETAYGRRRRLTWPSEESAQRRVANQARNSPIQGTVGDHILKVLPDVRRVVHDDFGGDVLMEVHDELLSEVHKEYAEDCLRDKLEAMRQPVPGIGKPIPCSGDIRSRWVEVG